jgi:ABC-2 type transport system ATP-binding protein
MQTAHDAPAPTAGGRTAAAIEAHDLVKTYHGGVRALDGLGFAVQAGTVFGLLGPNGAGKTTTVKILTTLSRPDAGRARVAGLDVLRQPGQVRRLIGVVAQHSGVDREATGRENLTLQGLVHGLRGRELRRRVAGLLERFGLAEAADRVVGGYSGGMQRRLDIALGLVHRPRVLFLDEPTTGLDPEVRADLWEEIARLAAGEGLTILLTTHYLPLPGGGRPPGQPPGDRRPRPHRGRGHPGRAQARAARRCRPGGAGRAGARRARRRRPRAAGHRPRGDPRGPLAARPQRQRRHRGALGAGRPRVGRRQGRLGHRGPPSLDDVYLRYTGRAFGEADEEAS